MDTHRRFALPALLLAATPAFATVSLHPLFTDGAVLQRDTPVPVWGEATREGERVTVTLGDKSVTTEARGGRWRAELPAMPAGGGPLTLTVKGDNTVTAKDVLLGEVWICSGQSNMEWTFKHLGQQAGVRDTIPDLRMFTVAKATATAPRTTVAGVWKNTTPATTPGFSAVAYHFGKALHAKLGVPVGLVVTAWGGTRIEAWMSPAALAATPAGAAFVAQDEAAGAKHRAARDKFEQGKAAALAAHAEASAKAKAAGGKPPRAPEAPRGPEEQNRAARLRHAMITPLLPCAMRGVIWYQGESNNGDPAAYGELFPAMIADWRKDWGRGDFPFLFVQIAPFRTMRPELREAQRLTLARSPNTAMAVTTDVGEANDIHPKRKQPVGERLALAARALAYGESVEYSGPLFAGATFADGKAVVTFTHTGGGLVATDGAPLKGFTLAGADGKFRPAAAVVTGDTVTVTAPGVAAPAAVRYGWDNLPDVNLANRAGLPASPFRSDGR